MLARYEIQLEYFRGKDNSIAYALSRVDPLSPEPQDAKQMNAFPVHQITNAIPATGNRLDRTRIATTADPSTLASCNSAPPTRRSNRAACHSSRISCANITTHKYRQPDIADTVCTRPRPSQY